MDQKEIKKQNKQIADDLAKSKGHDDFKDYANDVKEKLNSPNKSIVKATEKSLVNDLGQLLQLCLYQVIENNPDTEYMNFVDLFDDGEIAEGNSKEYIATKMTGADTFVKEQFIPLKVSKKSIESHVIQMYDANGKLNSKAYQFKKPITIQEVEYIKYFKKGAMNEFLTNLTEQLQKTYSIYKFEKSMNLITSLTPQKTVVGTADNMFDAFTNEVFPLIRKMKFINTDYNYNNSSKFIHNSKLSNLIILMSSNNIQKLESGIKTQLFNAQLLGVEGEIKAADFLSAGNKITFGDSDTDISVSTDEYLDDNTIIVLDRNAIKHVNQVKLSESQAWGENLTVQLNLHIWGALDILPWGKMFKYTNANLSVLPK